ERAVETRRENPELWFAFATALRRLGRYSEAIAALDQVLQIEPRSIKALLEKTFLHDLQGDPRVSISCYRAVLQLVPMIFSVWSPGRTTEERELLRVLTTYFGEYYGALSDPNDKDVSVGP